MTRGKKVAPSGVIAFEPKLCTGCGTCEIMCSSRDTGISNPKWSCITIHYDPTEAESFCDVCNQCPYPACLYACPEIAISVDEETGARYIDPEKCDQCGTCLNACPFTPDKAMIKRCEDQNGPVYIKCDLCRGRPQGPMCVQFCPTCALTFVDASSRKRRSVQKKRREEGKVNDVLSQDFFKTDSEKEKGGQKDKTT